MPLTQAEVASALDGVELVPAAQAALGEAKQIVDACLEADIPAVLGRDNNCAKGCAPKLYILVREPDVPKLAALFQQRWRSMMLQSGVDPDSIAVGIEAAEGENPPCPACGATGDLVEGACPECGLSLS